MHPKTRAERRHVRWRRSAWWRRYRRQNITKAPAPFQEVNRNGTSVDDSWWFEEGRFSKLTLACNGHHATCAVWRLDRKYRFRKRDVYAAMDRYDAAAWG